MYSILKMYHIKQLYNTCYHTKLVDKIFTSCNLLLNTIVWPNLHSCLFINNTDTQSSVCNLLLGGSQSSATTNESPAVTAAPGPLAGVGSTITISSTPAKVPDKNPTVTVARSPIAKGTITIRTADQNKPGIILPV